MEKADKAILPLIFLFFVDTVATIHWYNVYGVEEANPLMAFFLTRDVIYFFMVKMTLSLGGIAIIHNFYDKKICKIGLFVLYFAYIGVFLVHCGIFTSLVL
tara:strand:+ start:103 stop:405 length:303 start_codon:yes stop_codon:yes gene_type:complete